MRRPDPAVAVTAAILWALLGFFISVIAFLAIPLTVIARYSDIFVPGISTTLIIVLLLGGMQLMTLGVIGEYVGRIYDEVKRRPLYVVRDTTNVDTDAVGPRPAAF